VYCSGYVTAYGGEGNCLLHHIDDIGSSLDSADWDRTIKTDFGTLVSGTDTGPYTSDVTAAVTSEQAAGASHISFRLKGSIEDDDTATTTWIFGSNENGWGQSKPHLELVYSGRYENSGTFTSQVYDSGSSEVDWDTLSWTADVPSGTELKFQVATDAEGDGPWSFKGPDGTSATYYTSSGEAISSVHDGEQYIRYKAYLSTTDGTKTPVLNDVTTTYLIPTAPSPTSLVISPSSFNLEPGELKTLTATLTSDGSPVAGKTITWSKTAGSLSTTSGVTDSNGQVSVTYTAPAYETAVNVTASFAGDEEYQASSGNSSGIIRAVTGPTHTYLYIDPAGFTKRPSQSTTLEAWLEDENFNPLANETITWTTTAGIVDPLVTTTDEWGRARTTYTGPSYEATAIITALFAGDDQHESSSENAYAMTILAEWQRPFWTYEPRMGSVLSVAISSDGSYVAAGCEDDRVCLFSRESNTPIWSYTTGSDVHGVAISSDGSYLTAWSLDDKVYMFSRDSSTPLWSFKMGAQGRSIAISSDGAYVVVGTLDNKIHLFSRDSSTPIWTYTAGGPIWSVAISSDGSYIAAVGCNPKRVDGTLSRDTMYLFSRFSSTPLWSYSSYYPLSRVAISSDGSYIAVGGSGVYLFSRASSTPLWINSDYWGVYSISISSDGSYLVAGTQTHPNGIPWGHVVLFSRLDNSPLWVFKTVSHVYSVAISSDGSHVAAGSGDLNAYLFSRASNIPLWIHATDSSARVAISSDGSYIAVGSYLKMSLLEKELRANNPPSLSLGSVFPSSGTTDEFFTYEVTYTDADGDAPAYVRVYVDGSPYTMSKVSGTYTDGAKYRCTLAGVLSAGSHTYYFKASDGFDTVTTATENGPDVNTPPSLTSGSVSPFSGTADNIYTYEVIYTDADNDAPSFIKVYIDGTGRDMTKIGGTYTGGVLYRYSTSLSAGTHEYYFKADDGTTTARLPASGSFSGPIVTTTLPTVTPVTVTVESISANVGQTISVGENGITSITGLSAQTVLVNFEEWELVKTISVTTNTAMETISVQVLQLDQKPVTVPEPTTDVPGAAVSHYLEITVTPTATTAVEVESATIEFKVTKSWLTMNNIDPATVALLRYDDQWVELSTTPTGEDATFKYYSATTSGFSIFAVTGRAIPSGINLTLVAIAVVVTIAAIIGAAVFVKKRR
jgi:PGF-pre-PGF domain-containing protein